MKKLLFILLILFQISLYAQANEDIGIYKKTTDTRSDSSLYQLSLHKDGTFTFQYEKNIHCAACPQEELRGKGTWKSKKGILKLKAKKGKDINEEFSLNLHKTKAKFIKKDTKKLVVFYESEIELLKNIELIKTD